MFYDAQLRFLLKVLEKRNLQAHLLDPDAPSDRPFDLGLRRLLGLEEKGVDTLRTLMRSAAPNTIYRGADPFWCRYVYLLLPNASRTILLIGPYLPFAPTHRQVLERAEQYALPPRQVQQIMEYYSTVPTVLDEGTVFALLDALGEHLWGGPEAFSVVNLNYELSVAPSPLPAPAPSAPEDADWNIRLMEARYTLENELLEAVSLGLTHKAELLAKKFSQLSMEHRAPDALRNAKNYCIITNTLLRKAAEQGGVHPVYLDSLSSSLAHRIEQLSSQPAVRTLMEQMFHDYCRLVKKHSTRHYSPPIQKAVIHIDSDLTRDLSLAALAGLQNVNASYLSALFRKETGQTVTEYVSQRRIHHAMHLLRTTRLQIQTVAQHCGIPDVNYFSKRFKKYTGVTPKQYRAAQHTQAGGT